MSSKTITILSIAFALIIIGGTLFMSGNNNQTQQPPADNTTATQQANNVTTENGRQIISITAKGGYQPKNSTAKAGVPTILRIATNGTYDCSSSIRIPSLNISKNLPASGTTDIDLGTQTQDTLNGTCGMGMYSFQIEFK